LADFGSVYVRRVKEPLFAALGPQQATLLLSECLLELNISPFILDAFDYCRLVEALETSLQQRRIVDEEVLQRLREKWAVENIPESELPSGEAEVSTRQVPLPDDEAALARLLSESVLTQTLLHVRPPEGASEAQKDLCRSLNLLFGSVASTRRVLGRLRLAEAGAQIAAQLERYERITAFSRHLNTLDMERLREKMSLLPDVLSVSEVAVMVRESGDVYEPFYVSPGLSDQDLAASLLFASLAEETQRRRGVISGFEPEYAGPFGEPLIAMGASPYWLSVPLQIEDHFLGAVILWGSSNRLYTEDERNVVLRVCNHIASALQNCLEHKHVERLQRRLDEELQGVGRVQKALLPSGLPKVPGVDVWAYYRPSGRASGDYYEVMKVTDDLLAIMVADVAGHGAPAAVVMAMTKTAFKLFVKEKVPMVTALGKFNDFLCEVLSPDRFVTAFSARLDAATRRLEYVSAGHCPAIIHRADTGECELLEVRDIVLGVVPNRQFESSVVQVRQGDRLIIYTDGITEAIDADRETFGLQRLIDAIKASSGASAKGLTEAIVGRLNEFLGEGRPEDDITLLVFAF